MDHEGEEMPPSEIIESEPTETESDTLLDASNNSISSENSQSDESENNSEDLENAEEPATNGTEDAENAPTEGGDDDNNMSETNGTPDESEPDDKITPPVAQESEPSKDVDKNTLPVNTEGKDATIPEPMETDESEPSKLPDVVPSTSETKESDGSQDDVEKPISENLGDNAEKHVEEADLIEEPKEAAEEKEKEDGKSNEKAVESNKNSEEKDADQAKEKNSIEYLDLDTDDSQKSDKASKEASEENPLLLNEKETNHKEDGVDEDPMGEENFITENPQGADEELCIIPDTERVISQAEKDAAFSIRPLRDISSDLPEDGAAGTEQTNDTTTTATNKYVISKCNSEEFKSCCQCILNRKVKYTVVKDGDTRYICHDNCLDNFKHENSDMYVLNWDGEIRVKNLTSNRDTPKLSYERKCAVCHKKTDDEERNLTWEIMDFCDEFCLSKYQKDIGAFCASCNAEVRACSLGKYCVRFGNDIRQFCSSHCLEEYKKGLKVCSYCQQDISAECDGFLAPIGDKGQFKDFCSQNCMEKYDIMTNNKAPKVPEGTKCSVCKADKKITIEFESDGTSNYFCSDRCFVAFRFVNNITPGKCSMCRRNFQSEVLEKNTMFYDNVQYGFCSNSCQNIYIIAHRKIVPCVWCKVKKYNFDMIRRYFKSGPVLNMCSINCLNLFQVSVNAVNSKVTICNFCNKLHQPMYHLTMSDATIRNFCSYPCVMSFQNKFKKSPITLSSEESAPVPTGEPKKNRKYVESAKPASPPLPVISNVQSLANSNGNFNSSQTNPTPRNQRNKSNASSQHIISTNVEPQVKVKHHIIIKSSPLPDQRNVGTMCKVRRQHKSTTMRPIMTDKGVQTDQREAEKILIPVPVPIYIPSPLPMYSIPAPYPLPFPLPIPVPIFIPTTRNSAKGIMKEIKKIQVKIPTDPYEAELLMMAEMVAGDKKDENTDSESEAEEPPPTDDATFSPEPVDASNTFGEDMLQMALKMATELEEPAVDLEGALTANTITAAASGAGGAEPASEEAVDDPQALMQIPERQSCRGRKRGRGGGSRGGGTAKKRRMSQPVEVPVMATPPVPPQEPAEKPDAHLCLKYTFGVNAWKQWVTTKNADLEKAAKFSKAFKTEILQLTADELNYSLCLFVKEVRKPNGAEYAPDTIYYLCLGIQQYLFENGRIDNIFCDPYYEQFTDSLDEVARKFSVLYNDSHYIVTRVEEEHLWESKQLGAHSPHVLLSTLMFFNTKHFNLTSVSEHMQLSFSHIMKHWKRNPNQSGVARVAGSRNVLLRFYPPQTAIQSNSRKKKVYEQQENDENPLRCPVKLYEFYLSKCPESVKTRNDVFYLQPERSCVPDSPVWYSTSALAQEALEKMLHRVKMVKEINVALLTS